MSDIAEVPVAELVGDRAIVWNAKHGMSLYNDGYFGQPVGIRKPKEAEFDKPLELSLLECAYLSRNNTINVRDPRSGKILTADEIVTLGLDTASEFKDRYLVYTEVRDLGYIIRPGLKFGTDFAIYEHGPGKDHAPFLIHVIPQSKGVIPLDIVRAGRLATSVRKRFIIATVKETGDIAYYSFVWHKP